MISSASSIVAAKSGSCAVSVAVPSLRQSAEPAANQTWPRKAVRCLGSEPSGPGRTSAASRVNRRAAILPWSAPDALPHVSPHEAQVAYLSLTRGEGGQNLIGSELGDGLGIIRTQELMEARRIDGGEQFFTRAVDFGYSKTADESFAKWGKEEVLSDVVRVIRTFRPDVIITDP